MQTNVKSNLRVIKIITSNNNHKRSLECKPGCCCSLFSNGHQGLSPDYGDK